VSWVDIRTPPATGEPLGLICGYGSLAVEVADLGRAAAFYGSTLGFGRPEKTEAGLRFDLNGAQSLTLVQRAEPRTRSDTGVHQAYRIPRSQLSAITARLEASGAELHRYHEDRPAEREHDRYCADPAGNRVQLVVGSEYGIDHVAVETHDLEWAEVFYTQVLGARVEARIGWHMDDFARAWRWGRGEDQCAPGTRRWEKLYTDDQARVPRANAQAFFRFGEGVSYGVYLANEHRSEPPPWQFRGTPSTGLLVRPGALDELEARLTGIRLRCMESSRVSGGPFERDGSTLFVRDTGGNLIELREAPGP
jgi:extradiol dioxygenase family protein